MAAGGPSGPVELDVPVLAMIAGRSAMHDSAAAAETARRTLQRGHVEVYPDASHAPNGEYPDEIARDLELFLSEPCPPE